MTDQRTCPLSCSCSTKISSPNNPHPPNNNSKPWTPQDWQSQCKTWDTANSKQLSISNKLSKLSTEAKQTRKRERDKKRRGSANTKDNFSRTWKASRTFIMSSKQTTSNWRRTDSRPRSKPPIAWVQLHTELSNLPKSMREMLKLKSKNWWDHW